MADIKFSEFPKATISKDSDEIAILQDGVNKMIPSPVLESKIINKTVSRVIEQGGASLNLINVIGVVPTYSDLATITPTPELNDAYQVESDGLVYVYTENGFQSEGYGIKVQPDVNGIIEVGNNNPVSGGEVFGKTVLKKDIKYISKNLANKSTFINNEFVDFSNGIFTPNAEYVRTDFIPVLPYSDLSIRRGLNLIQTLAYYDENKIFISGVGNLVNANVYIGKTPANAYYVVANVSRYIATREFDINSFMLSYSTSVLPYEPFSNEIKGIGDGIIPIVDIDTFVGTNIADKTKFVDNEYVVSSSGAIITTGSSNYVRTNYIPILGNYDLSIRRGGNITNTLAYYDENKVFISGVGNLINPVSYVGKTPLNARYLIANVSNVLANRQSDKDAFMLSYSSEPLTYEPYTEYVEKINNIPLFIPNLSNYIRNIFKGKKGIMTGDSITAPSDSYIVRAFQSLGIEVVQNYGINGSTIAKKESDPTGRNPIISRFNEMTETDIDLVVVSATTNDCNYSWTPFGNFTDRVDTTYLGAMHLLCQGLQLKYAGKQILFITPIKRYANLPTPESVNDYGKTQKDYADAMIQVCSYWGIPVLDMFSESLINAFIPTHRTLFLPDGTHPNLEGKIIMGNRLSGFIKQLN